MSVLPIPTTMKSVIKDAMSKWSISINANKGNPIIIPVKRGVYQGDSLSPLLFVLVTGGIVRKIKEDPEINKISRGRQEIVAYMDDIKCHAPNQATVRAMTSIIEEYAKQLGLELNLDKCGHYCKLLTDKDDTDILPAINNGYKYLGLIQEERDTDANFHNIEEKIVKKASEILSSKLTTAQKRRLFNSSVIPAAVYVMGNMHPNCSVQGSLRRCRDLDAKIRKMMVTENIKTRPTSNQRAYLPHNIGGLGFRTIETETEIQYARKYAYLITHPELTQTKDAYMKLQAAGHRTPLGDFKYVAKKYDLEEPKNTDSYRTISKQLVESIKRADQERRTTDWAKSMNYPKQVIANKNIISFPAASHYRTDSSKLALINAAAEEQLFQLRAKGTIDNTRCRKGCTHDETAYHVVTTCQGTNYNTRHDQVVYWLLKTILQSTGAPEQVQKDLHFGRAAMNTDYESTEGQKYRIRAGQSILTERPLHHNKPDIMVQLLGPIKKTILFEVSIPHLQNYLTQEGIKRTKYCHNSVADIHHNNYQTIGRDTNLLDTLAHEHRCEVELGLFIVGCYGEVLNTEEHRTVRRLLQELGVPPYTINTVLRKVAYSVITSTSRIIMNHIRK